MTEAQEQSGRTAKVVECDTTFEPTSMEALLGGAGFQAWLRANRKAARDGIATNLALRILHDPEWSYHSRRSTIAFNGADFEAPVVPSPTPALVVAHPVMRGHLRFDKSTEMHCGEESWSMTRARLTEGFFESPRGIFYRCASPEGGSDRVVRFPYLRNYEGHFWGIPGSGFEVEEEDLHIISSLRETRTGFGTCAAAVRTRADRSCERVSSPKPVEWISTASMRAVTGDNLEEGTPGGLKTGGPPSSPVGLESDLLETAGVGGGTTRGGAG